MKSENYYWKKALGKLGVSTTGMKPVNYYLKKIYDTLGGESTSKRKSNTYYLNYISENIDGGGSGDCGVTIDYSVWDTEQSNLCTAITKVTIPSTVTTLYNGAVSSFTSLEEINLPNSITSFGNSVFSGCNSLKEIILPNNLASIGNSVFNNCTSLEEIDIPVSLTTIGYYIFGGCTSLEKVNLYWEENPMEYNSQHWALPNGAIFTIPKGTTSVYESANYPSEKLEERE